MRIAIIQFPGSNCESESIYAVNQAGMEPIEFLWNEDYSKLSEFDGYFIVGGFSYEDRSRSGVIACLDPLMGRLKTENEKGKPILGVCNGAQILVESGIVPGLKDYRNGMALAVNKRIKDNKVLGTGFYNAWSNVQLAVPQSSNAFSKHLKEDEFMNIPLAHGEGRFVIPEELLEEMIANNLTAFRYCDDQGRIIDEFPTNPNGAIHNLAGVCNAEGNALALMPHPERTQNGQPIFTSMRDYIREEKQIDLTPLAYQPRRQDPLEYRPKENSRQLAVELIITDNEADTVQNALKNMGLEAKIKKYAHWEITAKEDANLEEMISQIIKSEELHNSNKEKIVVIPEKHGFLVRYRDDMVEKSKKDTLENNFQIQDIKDIKKGVLWQIETDKKTLDKILKTGILFNQYSQICFELFKPEDNTEEYADKIRKNLKNCLTQTDLNLGEKKIGKVRDSYASDDKMILISTDRQSAFDRILASVPFKGQVLNQTSAWWFKQTQNIIPNHFLEMPDPNATVGKKCEIFPVEFVVRGYLTGSTDTSVWTQYKNGVRNYCGNVLSEGMKKNEKFAEPIVTPTTKSETHDRPITPKEIVDEGLMTQEEWDIVSQKALELFKFGQEKAKEHDLILVDTKYEFGKDKDGNILLCDEIHTPDSSRYWLAVSYQQRLSEEKEPENIDKEFLRLWFKDNCDPYNDTVLPEAPEDLVVELSRRYIQLYEMITGEKFDFPEDEDINKRIKENLEK